VPFGEFLTPGLRDVTTWLVRHGLDAARIPAFIDGYVIEIPEGTFFVAEACAGLRFLIASIAFGALYALLMYRTPMRRMMFIAVSVVVPVIANGFRAFGIIALGHLLGSAQAVEADHVLYGWMFFSIVILVLIASGLPFRQDNELEPAVSPMGPRRMMGPGWLAGLTVAVAAALGPAVALRLDRTAAAPQMAMKPLYLTPPCVAEAIPDLAYPARTIVQRVTCGGTPMTIQIRFFSPRSTAGPVNAERRHLTRLPGAEDMTEGPLTSQDGGTVRGWRLIQAARPAFLTAAALWIDGKPTTPGIGMRIGMARDSVTGGSDAPALVIITPLADWPRVDEIRKRELEHQISDLVESHPEIGEQVRAMARGAW
jgi:exosortase/archaeosortase family protein